MKEIKINYYLKIKTQQIYKIKKYWDLPKRPPKNIEYFSELLDNALKSLNSDYEAKRLNNITLDMPKINMANQGVFHKWLKHKNQLGGQHKIPRLSNSRLLIEALLKLNQ